MVKSCEADILEAGDNLIVIYFSSKWCQPCRIMCQEIDKLAEQEKDVVFLSVDVTQKRQLTAYINFHEVTAIHEVTGACGQVDKLKEAIKEIKMQKVQNETQVSGSTGATPKTTSSEDHKKSSSKKSPLDDSKKREERGAAFECNICLDVATDAVISMCGHLFCWPCLATWLETRPQRQICPVCKAGIGRDKVIPVYGRSDTERKDPRDKPLPPRPRGQRPEPDSSGAGRGAFGGGGAFGGMQGFQMSDLSEDIIFHLSLDLSDVFQIFGILCVAFAFMFWLYSFLYSSIYSFLTNTLKV